MRIMHYSHMHMRIMHLKCISDAYENNAYGNNAYENNAYENNASEMHLKCIWRALRDILTHIAHDGRSITRPMVFKCI